MYRTQNTFSIRLKNGTLFEIETAPYSDELHVLPTMLSDSFFEEYPEITLEDFDPETCVDVQSFDCTSSQPVRTKLALFRSMLAPSTRHPVITYFEGLVTRPSFINGDMHLITEFITYQHTHTRQAHLYTKEAVLQVICTKQPDSVYVHVFSPKHNGFIRETRDTNVLSSLQSSLDTCAPHYNPYGRTLETLGNGTESENNDYRTYASPSLNSIGALKAILLTHYLFGTSEKRHQECLQQYPFLAKHIQKDIAYIETEHDFKLIDENMFEDDDTHIAYSTHSTSITLCYTAKTNLTAFFDHYLCVDDTASSTEGYRLLE